MPHTSDGFPHRIAQLKLELAAQGRRVQGLLEVAFDAVFARDLIDARRAIDLDDLVDKIDVEIERSAVALLTEATAAGAALPAEQLRMILTIVKVNNELERIADSGVAVCELVPELTKQNV